MEGEAEWEVETILAHRHFGRQKKLQYLVKWLGYPESDNTWEPVENLHAEDLIQDYEHRWQGAARQMVAAIHLRVAQTKGSTDTVSKYQEYTEGKLHQLLGQTDDCSTAKEIAQEALRRLKVKQILRHQPRIYRTRKERATVKQRRTPSPSDEKPRYVNRDMSHEQSNDWDPPMRQLAWQFCYRRYGK